VLVAGEETDEGLGTWCRAAAAAAVAHQSSERERKECTRGQTEGRMGADGLSPVRGCSAQEKASTRAFLGPFSRISFYIFYFFFLVFILLDFVSILSMGHYANGKLVSNNLNRNIIYYYIVNK
jgi:hypothetical protein